MAEQQQQQPAGPCIDINADGQITLHSSDAQQGLHDGVAEHCRLIKQLIQVDGGGTIPLPATLTFDSVSKWDAFVLSQYSDPAEPTAFELAHWMRVGTFLNCDESVPKIAQLLGSMVDDAVVQCGRKRVPRLEWPPAFAVLADPLQGGPASEVLAHASVPLAQLLACLPRPLIGVLATTHCRDDRLALPQQFCCSRARAKDVVEALRLPMFCRSVVHLTSLDLSGNRMGGQVAAEVMPLLSWPSHLRVLNLSNNAISSEGLDALTPYLDPLSCLQELDLSRNAIRGDDSIVEFGEALAHLRALTRLDVSVNNFGERGAANLIERLPNLPRLDTVSLRVCGVGTAAATALARHLESGALPALRVLDISDNGIQYSPLACVLEAVRHASALEELYFSGNEVDGMIMCKLAGAVADAQSSRLRLINVGKVRGALRERPVAALGPGLPQSVLELRLSPLLLTPDTGENLSTIGLRLDSFESLTRLDISGCELTCDGFMNLIGRLHELRELDISGLSVEDHNVEVPDAFSRLSSLTRLNARKACDTGLGADLDFEAIMHPWLQGCARMPQLRHLDLSSRCSEVGCSVAELTMLTYLNLSGNRLSPSGLEALSHSLGACSRLQHLNVAQAKGKHAPAAAFDTFLLSVVELPELQHLDVSGCGKDSLEVSGSALGHLASLRELVWHKAPAAALPLSGLNLTALTALSSVDLAGTKIGHVDDTWDIAWLALLRPTLRSLNLKSTRLFGIDLKAAGDARQAMLGSEDRLKLEEVAQHLRVLTGLTALNLSGNAYPSMSSVALGEMLAGMRQLRVLKLRTMGLTPGEFSGVADVLPHLAHLSTLDVGRNKELGTESAVELARAVAVLLGLHELFLDGLPKACSKAVSKEAGEDGDAVVRSLGMCKCKSCDHAETKT